jgi:phosphoribosylglycinamide formyltransferase-1
VTNELKTMGKNFSIGVVASSGGAAVTAAYEIFDAVYPGELKLVVVTDRECGIESYCEANNIPCQRIAEKSKVILSQKIADHFSQQGNIDIVLSFFLRIITKELFATYPTLNIHPSLLPDFPNLNAVGQALDAKSPEIGATLHMVDDRVDGGEILAQTVFPIPPELIEEEAQSLSFCQKTYLGVFLFSALKQGVLLFGSDDKKGFVPIWRENNMEFDPPKLQCLDKKLVLEYRRKLVSMGYEKWLKSKDQ